MNTPLSLFIYIRFHFVYLHVSAAAENIRWAFRQDSHTIDVVVHLSGVVQQSEFLTAHYLPGLCIPQLVPGWKHKGSGLITAWELQDGGTGGRGRN